MREVVERTVFAHGDLAVSSAAVYAGGVGYPLRDIVAVDNVRPPTMTIEGLVVALVLGFMGIMLFGGLLEGVVIVGSFLALVAFARTAKPLHTVRLHLRDGSEVELLRAGDALLARELTTAIGLARATGGAG